MTKTSSTHSQSETKFQTNAKTTRYFSEAFKREKIKEVLEKRISVTNFSKLYGVSRTTVYKWIYEYSPLEKGTRQIIEMESEQVKTQKLLEKVADLERKIGQKQLTIDYLESIIAVANKDLGYDLKKKYEPRS